MSTLLYTPTSPQSFVSDSPPVSNAPTTLSDRARIVKMMKYLYQADQQTEFLNLQAEVDSLLQQLQTLKQQRQVLANQVTIDKSVGAQKL